MKKTVWDEAAIRELMARLDAKLGLAGAKLPIRFTNGFTVLGSFNAAGGGSFTFSNKYFQNPNWPDEAAISLIKHEYAHYMDYMIYGECGHGKTWKRCCDMIDLAPVRCYDVEWVRLIKKIHDDEDSRLERFKEYHVGDAILHPVYDFGVVVGFEKEGLGKRIIIDFPDVGRKTLSLAWVDENCLKE